VREYTEADWNIVMRVIRTDTCDHSAIGKAVVKMPESRTWRG
jgi:hypothetical protein